jgi:hypothetical protein
VLQELEALLISVAMGEIPNRQHATAYSTMRVTLLESYDAAVVPGFLQQCISIYKFREFITLYHGRPDDRRRLIAGVFDELLSNSPRSAKASSEGKSEFVSRVF